MATNYTVRFKNSTQNAYHFGIYQKFPESPGLDSIAWQVRGLGPGATNRADWAMDYDIAIADWDANENKYSGTQFKPAQLGQVYSVITVQGDIPTIQPTPTGTTSPGLIKLMNNTDPAQPVTMGFAVSGKLIAAERGVSAGATTIFSVHPTYYVARYRNIEEGQLASAGISVGPVKLAFENEYTDYTVEAAVEEGRIYLKPPYPTPSDKDKKKP